MYEKQTWKNGDVITEEKLNHMEEGISTGGGIYTIENVVPFDGEVTTLEAGNSALADITLQGELPKHDISVTFNGQNYTLPYGYLEGPGDYWGEITDNAPSFTNYPLDILYFESNYMVATPEAGTYTLKINETVGKFTVNDVFKENMVVFVNQIGTEHTLDKTYDEIFSALDSGKHIDFLFRNPVGGGYTQYFFGYSATTPKNVISLLEAGPTDGSDLTWRHLEFQYEKDGYPSTSEIK